MILGRPLPFLIIVLLLNLATIMTLPDGLLTATLLLLIGTALFMVASVSLATDRNDRNVLYEIFDGIELNAGLMAAIGVICLLIVVAYMDLISQSATPTLAISVMEQEMPWGMAARRPQIVMQGVIIFWINVNYVFNLTDRYLLTSLLTDSPDKVSQHIAAGWRRNLIGRTLALGLFQAALMVLHYGVGWTGTVYIFVLYGVFQFCLFKRAYLGFQNKE